MVVRDHPALSLSRQCRLLTIGRSSLYYEPTGESTETLALMRRIDELFLKSPFYGARQMVRHLRREGVCIGRRWAARLMRLLGLQAGAADQRSTSRAPGLALSAEGLADRAGEPCLVRRHHLHPGAARLPLPGGDHGLGEPPRPGLAAVEHAGRGLLHGRARRGPGAIWGAGDLQHRPGQPVHQLRLHRAACRRPAFGARWTAAAGAWTTSSSNGCGARSNTRRSTCTRSPTASPPGASSASGSASTTPSGCTRRWAGGRRPRPTRAVCLWIEWHAADVIGPLVRSASARIAPRRSLARRIAVRAAPGHSPAPVPSAGRLALPFCETALGFEHRTRCTSRAAVVRRAGAFHAQAGGPPGSVELALRFAPGDAARLAGCAALDGRTASATGTYPRVAPGLLALFAGDAGGPALDRHRLAAVLESGVLRLAVSDAVGLAPLRQAGLAGRAPARCRSDPASDAPAGFATRFGLPAGALAFVLPGAARVPSGLSDGTETRVARPSGGPLLLGTRLAYAALRRGRAASALAAKAGGAPFGNPPVAACMVPRPADFRICIGHGRSPC